MSHIQFAKAAGPMTIKRRTFLKITTALSTLAFSSTNIMAFPDRRRQTDVRSARWVSTWYAPPERAFLPPLPSTVFRNQTLRQIVRISKGGKVVRIRISNEFGTQPLCIGEARIAHRAADDVIVPGTDRALTFGGKKSIHIPAAGVALSDPTSLETPSLTDLAVSIYLPENSPATTWHFGGNDTSYISSGNVAAFPMLPSPTTTSSRYFLTGVSVLAESASATIVTFGDSITDGTKSTRNASHRWPDILASRLQRDPNFRHLAVANAGIGGNRLLHPGNPITAPYLGYGPVLGDAALARFDRDVLAQPGVVAVIVLLGVNDLGHPGAVSPASEAVSVEDLIQGYRQLINRAHASGMSIYGATLLPFAGAEGGYYTYPKEVNRHALNAWIRQSKEFDGVIDFDAVVLNPTAPSHLLHAYDSGDHLHPNDAGYITMGQSIPLHLFSHI